MGENQNEIGEMTDPGQQLRTAVASPARRPESRAADSGEQSRTALPSGSDKTVDLAELKENERRFRAIFESAPIGIVIADSEGRLLEANDSFTRMLGYNSEELSQLTILAITDPSDRPETERLIHQVRDGSTNSYSTEKRYLKKDGKKVWVRVRTSAIRDRHSSIKSWLGLIEDISERKTAEQAIRESEEKYHNILEGIEEGYFEVDLSGTLTSYNNAICRILGCCPDELRAKNYRNFISHITARKIKGVFKKVYKTGRPARVLNCEVITKDDTNKILFLSASLMRDDDRKPVGFRGIVQDVTDQLIAEKQKRQGSIPSQDSFQP